MWTGYVSKKKGEHKKEKLKTLNVLTRNKKPPSVTDPKLWLPNFAVYSPGRARYNMSVAIYERPVAGTVDAAGAAPYAGIARQFCKRQPSFVTAGAKQGLLLNINNSHSITLHLPEFRDWGFILIGDRLTFSNCVAVLLLVSDYMWSLGP